MSDVSRRPSPATRRQTRSWRGRMLAVVLVGAALLTGGASVPMRAADGDTSPILDRPIVDVAFVDRGAGASPDLLTVALDDTTFGQARLTLLRRESTWVVEAEESAGLTDGFDGSYPWLIQVEPDLFAMIVTTGAGSTLAFRIELGPADSGIVAIGPPIEMAIFATDAGVADATGDGTPDLILAGPVNPAETECPSAGVAVVSGRDWTPTFQQSVKVPRSERIMRLAGAALGEWDGRPGIDLLANAYESCPSLPDYGEQHHLLVIRLNDGAVVVDRATSPEETAAANPWPSQPLVLDVDADGHNEALIATDAGLRIVDPSDGWRTSPVGGSRAVVLAATAMATGATATSVTWARATDDRTDPVLGVARVTRVDGSMEVDPVTVRTSPDLPAGDFAEAVARVEAAAMGQQPLPSVLADVDGGGCADVVVPLMWVGCETGEVQRGPSWLDSRPLGLVGTGPDRRLLVAAGLDWYPYLGGPQAPAPLAARAPGAWRSGPSPRFVLAEVPLGAIRSAPGPAIAMPEIRRAASRDGVVEFRWPAGTRLLVRAVPSGAGVQSAQTASVATRDGFLHVDAVDGEFAGLVPRDPGQTDGTSSSLLTRFDLHSNVLALDRSPAERWIVSAVALDAFGAISEPVQATAVIDHAAPSISLDAPPLSPPWPFGATLRGTTEAGASVSLPSATPVVAGSDGSFELPAQLAPWPQTLELTAVDPAGNIAVASVWVMGGVDIQGLPWPAIGALVVLLAVVLSSLRGARRLRPSVAAGGLRQMPDDDHGAVIEELGSGRIRRGD